MTRATDADRRRLAVFLFRHGPTPGPAIRAAFGWNVSRFLAVVYGPDDRRFMMTNDGWALPGAGERLSAPPPPLNVFA